MHNKASYKYIAEDRAQEKRSYDDLNADKLSSKSQAKVPTPASLFTLVLLAPPMHSFSFALPPRVPREQRERTSPSQRALSPRPLGRRQHRNSRTMAKRGPRRRITSRCCVGGWTGLQSSHGVVGRDRVHMSLGKELSAPRWRLMASVCGPDLEGDASV